MIVQVHSGTLRQTKFHEYAIRFLCGGVVTAVAGIVSKKFGPGIGGLLLAFPAILPASSTLLQKHEKERRQRRGVNGTRMARKAVAANACGATLGSLALIAFAAVVWQLLPLLGTLRAIAAATGTWMVIAPAAWFLWKRL